MEEIQFNSKAQYSLYKGVKCLRDSVGTTLSPKGRNVALGRQNSSPRVVHDGVSVAKEIRLSDKYENMGASLVREASLQTNDKAGDGTTTATILAEAIFREGLLAMQDKTRFFFFQQRGANPMTMKSGMDKAVKEVIKTLKLMSKKIVLPSEIEQIATISSSNSKIGIIVADSLNKVGKNGVLDVQDGNTSEVEVEITEGLQFDKGYISHYFRTHEDKSEIKNPSILITDKSLSSITDVKHMLEILTQKKKELVIIAEDITGDALSTLVINNARGNIRVNAIKCPEFGDKRKDILEDMAILTGATVISEEAGKTLDTITFEDFGLADKVISYKDTTQIIGGKGDKDSIKERVELLQKQMNKTRSSFEKDKLEERLAKLSNGVGVIYVGASTEPEMSDLKERIIDAIGAARSASEEGIIAGGGVALLKARESIKTLDLTGDEHTGAMIIYNALSSPIEQIMENAGEDYSVIKKIIDNKNDYFGYNIMTKNFGDMFLMGVIDPLKVVRLALENAFSVGFMLMTTEVLIAPKEKEQLQGQSY